MGACASGQGVAQAAEDMLPLPGTGRRPLGQGCVPVGAGHSAGGQDVHAPTLGVLAGDDQAHTGQGLGVSGRQGGAKTGFVEAEEVQLRVLELIFSQRAPPLGSHPFQVQAERSFGG